MCELSYGAAHYLHDRLIETGLFSEAFNRPFLKEFALHTDIPADRLQQALLDGGFSERCPQRRGSSLSAPQSAARVRKLTA